MCTLLHRLVVNPEFFIGWSQQKAIFNFCLQIKFISILGTDFTTNYDPTKPLILWMQGGPGCKKQLKKNDFLIKKAEALLDLLAKWDLSALI